VIGSLRSSSLSAKARDLLVLPSGSSFAAQARRERFLLLAGRFERLDDMEVVDLGGTPEFWREAPVRPRHVTCVNIACQSGNASWVDVVEADVCDIRSIGRFDLVFSNSTIEHLGGHARRLQFAETVRSLAPHYWVQTPNRYFPLEPHFVFPFMQLLPTRARAAVAANWPLSNVTTASPSDAVEKVLEIELLTVKELGHYFPGASILRERVLGLTKSFIAVS
jgi:hypothetical protein